MTNPVGTPRPVSPADLPEAWHGAATWTSVPGGQQPWRVRPEHLERIMCAEVDELAQIPNGVRLELETDARALEVELTTAEAHARSARYVDVMVDGELVATRDVSGRVSLRVELPGRPARVELWLPHAAPTVLHRVLLHEASECAPAAPRGPRWAVYGSSITQCNQADSPTGTWPALVAAQNSYELTALGMAGHRAAEVLQRHDPLITLIDGSEIITAQEMPLLGDLLHPTPEGYRVMAERLAPRLAAALD